MKIRQVLLAATSVFLLVTGSAKAGDCSVAPYSTGLQQQLDQWENYLVGYGSPALTNAAGILAYGDTVANGDDALLNPKHKTDVSTIFVENPAGDFIRVATSVPDGVTGSHQTAVGTTLPNGGLAWTALTAGNEYCGTVNLFGTNYDAIYKPIKNSGGTVIGALFVGNEAP